MVTAIVVIFSLFGCAAETFYAANKSIGVYLGSKAKAEAEKTSKTTKEELIERLYYVNSWVNIEKTENSVKILAFDVKKTDFVTETEYILDMNKYLSMSIDEKKVHIRNYFKERTGYDLGPVETVQTETPKETITRPSPSFPIPAFAPQRL